MNALELALRLASLLMRLLPVIEKLGELGNVLSSLFRRAPRFSYENLSLHLTLDLIDPEGRRAIIKRSQRVRFLSTEAGVITNPVWGEGEQLWRYEAAGVERIGSRREGAKQVLLLRLPERPTKGSTVTVTSSRQVADGYLHDREYFEAAIERPTRRLNLRVVFPKGRPPKSAFVVSNEGDPRRLTPRLSRSGRTVIAWRGTNIPAGSARSLRWSW